jgi:predicted transcriptional regulator
MCPELKIVINYNSAPCQNTNEESMNQTFKQFIENIACQKAPGPSTMFTAAHVFFALELMSEKPIGRNKLAKNLEVGEGTVRTIINRLRKAELIVTSKEGCHLTSQGFAIWKKFKELFPKSAEIGETELTNAEFNYAILVKEGGNKVKSGIEQRDAAIVAGANRAVIMVSRGGHLIIESVSNNLEQQFPSVMEKILNTLQPEENSVIVLVGARTLWKAKQGAFAASWTLTGSDE